MIEVKVNKKPRVVSIGLMKRRVLYVNSLYLYTNFMELGGAPGSIKAG
jgi:hypothetical protein